MYPHYSYRLYTSLVGPKGYVAIGLICLAIAAVIS